MSATFSFSEDNGAQTGSPTRGTTRTSNVVNVNWKNIDDATTAYASSPVSVSTNSYTKYQFGVFSGTFNQISNCVWDHTGGVLGTGLTLKGTVTSTYATPSTSTNGSLTTNMTSVNGSFPAGAQTVLFSTVGPQGSSPTSTLVASGYTQYLATQMQVASNAGAGDSASVVFTLQFNEN